MKSKHCALLLVIVGLFLVYLYIYNSASPSSYVIEEITDKYEVNETTQESAMIEEKEKEPRICSSQERVETARNWCASTMGKSSFIFKHFKDMTIKELQYFTRQIWVDDQHKVLWCNVPKAG